MKHQNFLIIFGTPPGDIVGEKTDMVYKIADIMNQRYEKKFLVLQFPDAFNHLHNDSDAKGNNKATFEIAASSTI